ncbi:CDP-glycerol glycerophosphotransferase family protein [Exiguobacterium sp. s56]|uniref:CDP-glycerol glycerophosphotransferase family protein n=1 Tax=Exiguobacterium sp. s56 TaxID=2751232 RepID=UPI0020376654|nr:CDP-glycerol glycerophosphotransferase family protein [Exiguobacterium sp. s56]
MKNKIKHLLKKNNFIYEYSSKMYKKAKTTNEKCFFFFFYNLFRIFPIKRNKIVLCSYFGKDYGDNSKYIAEEIINKGLDYDMVWLLDKNLVDDNSLPLQIRPVKYGSIKSIYEMATASVWIDNARQPYYVRKRKRQYYIQAWHGSPALKKIEKDAETSLSVNYVNQAKLDSKKADLFLSNCKWYSELVKSSFWYEGEILECGSPRNDILFFENKKTQDKIRNSFNFSNDIKIALYAPTFRTDYSLDAYKLDYEKFVDKLNEKFGGEWKVIVRLHPNIQHKAEQLLLKDNIVNGSNYGDLQELLSIADVIVTDYSSLMFDFVLKRKPCFLYAVDVEEYKKDRDFYFSFNELPFTLSKNNEELINAIEKFDNQKYLENIEKFLMEIGSVEKGTASKMVVQRIEKVTNY